MPKKIVFAIVLIAVVGYGVYHLATIKNVKNENVFYGTIEATQIKLSAEVMGRVLEVSTDEGDKVKKGQELVRIDHETLDAQLEQANAAKLAATGQYRMVGANIKNVDTNLKRSGNLLDVGSISKQQYDMVDTQDKSLKAQRQAALGQIKQAEAMAKLVETKIARSLVVAPISGVVLTRSIEPGEMVTAGTALLTLANLENCWVRIFVPEPSLGKIKLGQKVKIVSDSYPNKYYEGKIATIASEAEFTPKSVQTKKERVRLVFAVKVEVPNPNGELKIGMPVDAELVE